MRHNTIPRSSGSHSTVAQLRQVERRLVDEHVGLSAEVVRDEIRWVQLSLIDAQIITFLPILVERAVAQRLPAQAAHETGASLPLWSWHTAGELLAEHLPRRWAHTRGVVARAVEVAYALPRAERPILVAAACLHDVGYADPIVASGLHQLDGARFLLTQGVPRRVCALVAHHAGARAVAAVRGLSAELDEFDDELGVVRDALWYCDMTTGPDGQIVSFGERMRELRQRRAADDPVIKALRVNEPERAAAVRRTESLLRHELALT